MNPSDRHHNLEAMGREAQRLEKEGDYLSAADLYHKLASAYQKEGGAGLIALKLGKEAIRLYGMGGEELERAGEANEKKGNVEAASEAYRRAGIAYKASANANHDLFGHSSPDTISHAKEMAEAGSKSI